MPHEFPFEDEVTAEELQALQVVAKLVQRVVYPNVGVATIEQLPARGSHREYPNGEMVWLPDKDARWMLCLNAEGFVAPDIDIATGEVSYPS